jgi:hypothetical protein
VAHTPDELLQSTFIAAMVRGSSLATARARAVQEHVLSRYVFSCSSVTILKSLSYTSLDERQKQQPTLEAPPDVGPVDSPCVRRGSSLPNLELVPDGHPVVRRVTAALARLRSRRPIWGRRGTTLALCCPPSHSW